MRFGVFSTSSSYPYASSITSSLSLLNTWTGYLAVSLSKSTSKLFVPSFIDSPKIILYETPLSSSISENTAAPNSTSAVSSKLAFLSTETSLTRLIPLRLMGVKLPLTLIQSAKTVRWR